MRSAIKEPSIGEFPIEWSTASVSHDHHWLQHTRMSASPPSESTREADAIDARFKAARACDQYVYSLVTAHIM